MHPMESTWRNQREKDGPCTSCPGCLSSYPLAFGDEDADIMLVGMEPAYNVDTDRGELQDLATYEEAMPILIHDRRESQNPLWRHMVNVALAAECQPEDLYFTNIAKCGSGDFDSRVNHCLGYFRNELVTVRPKLILLHGGKVINKVYEMYDLPRPKSVGSVHGKHVEFVSATLLPLYHWGYAYRNNTVDEYDKTVANAVEALV